MSNHTTQFQGWTASPQGRGSIGIIWTCVITLGLCSWSAVCVNIPSRGDSGWKKAQRKAWLTFISLVGPEYLLALALGQWSAARQSVKEFHDLGYMDWTLRHGFYAEMGGFLLQTRNAEPFPLCNKSLLYLIREGLITDDIVKKTIILDPRIIKDRNKADTLFRLIALAQALWFVINCIARFIQHLPVTTLELTVLGYFSPTATTYILWWHKPCDVDTADFISIELRIDEIYARGGPAAEQPWHHTPLDFIDREEWHGSLLYRYWLHIINTLNPLSEHKTSSRRTRRSDNDFLPTPFKSLFLLEVLPTIPFFGANYIAWNHKFPSNTERDLWRTASITMSISFAVGALIEFAFSYLFPPEKERLKMRARRLELEQYRHAETTTSTTTTTAKPNSYHPSNLLPTSLATFPNRFKRPIRRLLLLLRNNSPTKDPNLDVPLKLLIPATILAIMYCISRMYIFVEDAIAFRSMPAGTYDTVQWMQFLPHYG